MKTLLVFAGICVLALPAHAQPARPVPTQAVDAERSALARQYLELAKPDLLSGESEVNHTLAFYSLPRTMEDANLSIERAPPSSSPISRIVYRQLRASFERGARRIAPKLVEALVVVYARLLTVDELRALIASEEQPSRRAAVAAAAQATAQLQAFSDAEGARWDEELKTGRTIPLTVGRLRPLPNLVKKAFLNEPNPAPQDSPTWKAIVAKQRAIHLATYAELNRLWPEAAAIAQADYCAHVRCGPTDRQILTGLGQVFADPYNHI